MEDSFTMSLFRVISRQFGAVNMNSIIMIFAKYGNEKFTSLNDFGLLWLNMRALMVQQGLHEALEGESRLGVALVERPRKYYLRRLPTQIFLALVRC